MTKVYYPVNLDIEGKKCLIVGGGQVAERKVLSLLKYGAAIVLVSPDVTKTLQRLVKEDKIKYIEEGFNEAFLKDVFMVIGATDNPVVNKKIAALAKKMNILTNIVDSPRDCNFIVPSVVQQGNLQISISTGGSSPALAKKIRIELENRYGIEYNYFLKLMNSYREEIINNIPGGARAALFQKLTDADIIDLIKKGNKEKASQRTREIIDKSKTEHKKVNQ